MRFPSSIRNKIMTCQNVMAIPSSLSKNALTISLLLLNCFNKVHKLYGTQKKTSKFAYIPEEILIRKLFWVKKAALIQQRFLHNFLK